MVKTILKSLLVIFIISGFAFYWLGPAGTYYDFLSNHFYLLISLSPVIAGLYALFAYGLTGARSRGIALIVLSLFLRFLGEFTWISFDLVFNLSPFPSIADIFFLASYPIFFLGVRAEIKLFKANLNKIPQPSLTLLIIWSLFITLVTLYFGVFLAFDPSASILNNVLKIGYGLVDLILVLIMLFSIAAIHEIQEGKFAQLWLFIFIANIFLLFADILFAIYTPEYEAGNYLIYRLVDSGWLLYYLLMAYALYKLGSLLKNIKLLK